MRGVCLGAGGSLGVVAAVWEFKGATYTQAELSVTLLDAEACGAATLLPYNTLPNCNGCGAYYL